MSVRLAVAGAGLIGQRHIEEIDASPSATLAAIVDPFPAAAEVAAKFSVPLYSSLAELFVRDKPDGVILATPNQLHRWPIRSSTSPPSSAVSSNRSAAAGTGSRPSWWSTPSSRRRGPASLWTFLPDPAPLTVRLSAEAPLLGADQLRRRG